jgi:hypothetical protein
MKAAYAGFTRKDLASAWGRFLVVTHDIATGVEARSTKVEDGKFWQNPGEVLRFISLKPELQ